MSNRAIDVAYAIFANFVQLDVLHRVGRSWEGPKAIIAYDSSER